MTRHASVAIASLFLRSIAWGSGFVDDVSVDLRLTPNESNCFFKCEIVNYGIGCLSIPPFGDNGNALLFKSKDEKHPKEFFEILWHKSWAEEGPPECYFTKILISQRHVFFVRHLHYLQCEDGVFETIWYLFNPWKTSQRKWKSNPLCLVNGHIMENSQLRDNIMLGFDPFEGELVSIVKEEVPDAELLFAFAMATKNGFTNPNAIACFHGSKTICTSSGGIRLWRIPWREVWERLPEADRAKLEAAGAVDLRWECGDLVSDPLPLWVGPVDESEMPEEWKGF